MSPRSALRTRMSATGARARLEGIVINSRHTIPVSPRARIGAACRRAAHPSPLIPAQARIRSPKQGPAFAGTSANEFTGEAAGLRFEASRRFQVQPRRMGARGSSRMAGNPLLNRPLGAFEPVRRLSQPTDERPQEPRRDQKRKAASYPWRTVLFIRELGFLKRAAHVRAYAGSLLR